MCIEVVAPGMKNLVGLKELREHMDTYLAQIRKGRSFVVVRRSKPVFKISPPEEAESWETVVDFTEFSKDGIPASQLLKKFRSLNERPR